MAEKALGNGKVTNRRIVFFAAPLALLAVGCVASTSAREHSQAGSPDHSSANLPSGFIGGPGSSHRQAGYLTVQELPDGLLLVPPSPQPNSAGQARDLEAAQRAIAQRGSARWELATSDAELFTPDSTGFLSCAAGRQIDAEATPATFKVLRRAGVDFANSTASVKDHYKRPRPFAENGQPSCTPEAEHHLRPNGSYPSGHSALGYGWGLVMAQLIPDRTTELVARARAFGDSRRICNVHWLSDVEEGRVTATATFVRLHANPEFQADLEAARKELVDRAAVPSKRDCQAEAAALSQS